jgi:hypothetical protein
VVLHGRVRKAQAVGGCLLRSGDEDCSNHAELTVGGARDRKVVGGGAIPFGTVPRGGVDLLETEFSRKSPRRGEPLIAALDG